MHEKPGKHGTFCEPVWLLHSPVVRNFKLTQFLRLKEGRVGRFKWQRARPLGLRFSEPFWGETDLCLRGDYADASVTGRGKRLRYQPHGASCSLGMASPGVRS